MNWTGSSRADDHLARIKLIKARHRALLRSEGKPVNLVSSEVRDICHRIEAGETSESIAHEYGVTPARIHRVAINRRVAAGLAHYSNELTEVERKAIMGMVD